MNRGERPQWPVAKNAEPPLHARATDMWHDAPGGQPRRSSASAPSASGPINRQASRLPTRLLVVRYRDQDARGYVVESLAAHNEWSDQHDEVEQGDRYVTKRRRSVEQYPPRRAQHPRGLRLMRWSHAAVLAALLGGVGGVLLGVIVTLTALARLARLQRRVWRWRHATPTTHVTTQLPAPASAERFRLLAALGQGLVAVGLGALITLLLARYFV